jgi:O-antigen ligase
MYSIQTYEQDASAVSRLRTWTDGFHWALAHPFRGAGFEGWRYVTQADWHSSYVEIMAEHGLIAFAMWFSLLFGTLISLTRLPRRTRRVPEMGWVENYSLMLRASLIAYASGTVFLGLSYWDIFYHIVFIAVLTKQFALAELAERQQLQTVGARQAAQDLGPSGALDVPRSYPA